MFKRILRQLLYPPKEKRQRTLIDMELTPSIQKTIQLFEQIFHDDALVVFREFESNDTKPLKACAIFITGMVDQKLINENIIEPIQKYKFQDPVSRRNLHEVLTKKVVISANLSFETDIHTITTKIMNGETALIIDILHQVILADAKKYDTRAIEEPTTEIITKGPKEAFTESILTNSTMIRRKIKDPALKFQRKEVGKRTKTHVFICYIEDIADQKLIDETHKRLDEIEIDGIIDSGYIEELIRDHPFSPYQTINHTERPDSIAAHLLEGRIALLVDGSPFALSMPFLFMEYLQNPEDYYLDPFFSSFLRIIRIVGFFVSISLPSIYISLTTFHQEMLPTPLLLSIFSARQAVPFPIAVETILLVLIFDVLRETGARMPSPIGVTISFLGAIVIGQAAVEARIISPILVVIVAMTGISTFLLPKMYNPLAITRLYLIAWSSILGLYGYIFGMIGLLIHLVSIRSWGIPYLLGTGTFQWEDIRDTALRVPWWMMRYRPKLIGKKNPVRQKSNKEQ